MSATAVWFVLAALLTMAGWLMGRTLGRGGAVRAAVGVLLAVGGMFAWAWLIRRPSVAVEVIPVGVLSRIEGVGAVPLFAAVLGVAWSRCHCGRQRVVVAWAMVLGAVYFHNGGGWLLQSTPSSVMGQTIQSEPVRQSQDYSCVPAACATALNLLGLPTTEAQMADLTQVRAGRGATLIRALDGLGRRLVGTGVTVHLIEPTLSELAALPMPAVTPLQFEPTRQHMVTLTRVTPRGVWFLDPMDGYDSLPLDEFAAVYRGRALIFERALNP